MPDTPTHLDLDAIRDDLDAIRDDLDASDRDLKKWVRLPVKYVRAALAEIERLRAEVARPAPAWDEDAEVDREALRRFVDSFCDDEAGEVEHVVSADGTSGFALTGGNDAHAVLRKAASALWPVESRTEVGRLRAALAEGGAS